MADRMSAVLLSIGIADSALGGAVLTEIAAVVVGCAAAGEDLQFVKPYFQNLFCRFPGRLQASELLIQFLKYRRQEIGRASGRDRVSA